MLFFRSIMGGVRAGWIQDSNLEPPYFSLVKFCQHAKQSFTFRKKEYLHDAVVVCRLALANQPPALGPLDKANNGVVALLEKFGQFGDGGGSPLCEPCNTKKQLVLLGRKTIRAGGSFTEAQKLSKLVTKVCQLAEAGKCRRPLGRGEDVRTFHGEIISHCDISGGPCRKPCGIRFLTKSNVDKKSDAGRR